MLDSVLRAVGAYRLYEGRLKAQIETQTVPSHIGIILDGNRRWAAN
jgi:short-chain Z-isoprenyl diphosphate synthase